MKYMTGMFGHFEEWQVSDRHGDRLDPRPPRFTGADVRRRKRRSK
jgi:hypothetical protein